MENDKFIDMKRDLPKDFYSTTSFTDQLLDYFKDRDNDKPFFAYLPFTAPHWPLQAPQEAIEKYKGMYDDGPDALRQRRLDKLVELGLVPRDVEPAPMTGLLDPDWEQQLAPMITGATAHHNEVCFLDLHDCSDLGTDTCFHSPANS